MGRIFIFLCAFFAINAPASGGKISGYVSEQQSGQPVIGAIVALVGTGYGMATDENGYFILEAASGEYLLRISFPGYEPYEIPKFIVKDEELKLSIQLKEDVSTTLQEVVVRSALKKDKINAMISYQKNLNTVAQTVSGEAIKRSPDKNTAQVLKRVSGASVQEGKFLIVRGLADRYNQAMVNGALMTSTQPDRKTFSFDLFPASVIDFMVIQKAATPELPGEFAGGLVQIFTRDFPSENFFSVKTGAGFRRYTTGSSFITNNTGTKDWLGIDDGSRSLNSGYPASKKDFEQAGNAEKNRMAKSLKNNWKLNQVSAPLNSNLELTGGLKSGFAKGEIGLIASLSYQKNYIKTYTERKDEASDGTPVYAYKDEKDLQEISWGGLANLSYRKGDHKISWKNLFHLKSDQHVTVRNGMDFSGPAEIRGYELGFVSGNVFTSQLSGEHTLPAAGKINLKWNGNFAEINQSIPDLKRLTYQRNAGNDFFEANIPQGSASLTSAGRFFSELKDRVWGGGLDAAKKIRIARLEQNIKIGALYQYKDRNFSPRALGYIADRSNPLIQDIIRMPVDRLFEPEHMGQNLIGIDETTNPKDQYQANGKLSAAYFQAENKFSEKLNLTWGLRFENYHQEVRFNEGGSLKIFSAQASDFLPAANLKLLLNERNYIRFAVSKTVIRPEFRELSEFRFYNFDLMATEGGNPHLKRTEVTNAEVRYEWYPANGEVLTAGVFYKHFKNPIERFYNTTGAGSQSLIYGNTPSANAAGAELEFRKSVYNLMPLKFTSEFWKNWFVFANAAWVYNRVQFENGSILNPRPMQGQSDYVLNGGIMGEIPGAGTSFSLLANRVGRRIFLAGNGNDQPDIWEAPRTLLDFQLSQPFLKKGTISISISDLLQQSAVFYEDKDGNGKWNENKDVQRYKTGYGTSFGISVAYSL